MTFCWVSGLSPLNSHLFISLLLSKNMCGCVNSHGQRTCAVNKNEFKSKKVYSSDQKSILHELTPELWQSFPGNQAKNSQGKVEKIRLSCFTYGQHYQPNGLLSGWHMHGLPHRVGILWVGQFESDEGESIKGCANLQSSPCRSSGAKAECTNHWTIAPPLEYKWAEYIVQGYVCIQQIFLHTTSAR